MYHSVALRNAQPFLLMHSLKIHCSQTEGVWV